MTKRYITYDGISFDPDWVKRLGAEAFLVEETGNVNHWPTLHGVAREQKILDCYKGVTGEDVPPLAPRTPEPEAPPPGPEHEPGGAAE